MSNTRELATLRSLRAENDAAEGLTAADRLAETDLRQVALAHAVSLSPGGLSADSTVKMARAFLQFLTEASTADQPAGAGQ